METAGATPVLRMDFDFKEGGGFVVARHVLHRSMPEEYALRYRLRGRGAVIQLEMKLADPTGRNVWRHVITDLHLPARWRRMTVASRDIEFAWGPQGSGAIAELGALEIAVVCREAGHGTLWIADLEVVDSRPPNPPLLRASSELGGTDAADALRESGWRPLPADPHPWLLIDFTAPRLVGGLVIDWRDEAPAKGFRVCGSNTGVRFKTLYKASAAGGKRSYVYLPGAELRFLRLELREASTGAVVQVKSFEFARSIDAFWYHVASAEARGWHPRWLHREQTLWTPIGTADGVQCALMNGDGMVEVSQGSFSIEPMLWIEQNLVTWSDVTPRQALRDDYLPVPCVSWETADWRLSIEAETTQSGAVRVRYRFENRGDRSVSARLYVLLRPYQVTPPWQSFRGLGGMSPIRDIIWRDGAVQVNEALQIVPHAAPLGFGALRFDEGFMASHLGNGNLPAAQRAHDAFGYITAALAFDASCGPHGGAEHAVTSVAPRGAGSASPDRAVASRGAASASPDRAVASRGAASASPDRAVASRGAGSASRGWDVAPRVSGAAIHEPAYDWAARLAARQWAGSGWAMDAIHAALTATAHILITRSGPALQPGPRRYTRSWIRDGAMMSAALLRMRETGAVRDFIAWYAPHQRADGFVPCCVDALGIDWLVEHDSHGQLIALIADYYRFTADSILLEQWFGYVEKAVGYIAGALDPTGLLPISVSHEGYLAQPVHAYWDDFWALRGLADAVFLARTLGREAHVQDWEAVRTRFAAALFKSIAATRAQRHLDFIPGSVEWADFDPTATANAIYLVDLPDALDRRAVERTFDIYLAEWRRKRQGTLDWFNYTPYEIRIIGALVRLGRRDAALELLKFFLSDRRPLPWNQWPEIAWRDRTAPAHVGDLPHTWIAAEYVLAVRALFAFEHEAEDTLILAAGLAPEWIDGDGVRVDKMPTLYGELSYSLRRIDSRTLQFVIGDTSVAPVPLPLPVPLILRPPLGAPLNRVTIDGKPSSAFDAESVRVPAGSTEVVCTAW
jgi:hypothetical protein